MFQNEAAIPGIPSPGNSILTQIWSKSKMMEYLVNSLRSRRRFEEKKRHILNLVEIKPNEINIFVQELLDAFQPITSNRGLKIKVENLIKLPD